MTHEEQGPDVDGLDIGRGTQIGRYVVLSRLGAGAMGVVLAAYDPELDRKVALKLLKSTPGAGSDATSSRAQARLQREAQALAKLDHPNVVGVHDVGTHEGQLFIGMDFVEGQTLRQWMKSVESPRPWSEVLQVFAEAGRGLAAAHEAGLVHRDFKPDNVMLGKDGRVRVMDFGLARTRREGKDDDAPEAVDDLAAPPKPSDAGAARSEPDPDSQATLAAELTKTGALLGTPAYMAAEQLVGRIADARSDQFAFCVALHEALYGERPFDRSTLPAMFYAVSKGDVTAAPRGTSVPARVRRVVLRGLRPDPAERWPSMAELLAALDDDLATRRSGWLVGAAVVVAIGGAVWGLGSPGQPKAAVCDGMEDRLDGIWDEDRKAELSAAFAATGLEYAPGTWARAAASIDEYAMAWVDQRRDSCLATHRGEQSDQLLDLRMACLDDRLVELGALVDALAAPDESVVEKAILAVGGLSSLEHCRDVEALTSTDTARPDADVAEQVAALNQRLAGARALQLTGQYDRGLEAIVPVAREAEAIGYQPLLVEVMTTQGLLQRLAGKFDDAEASMTRAYEFAVAARMPIEAAEATSSLMAIVGYDLARFEDGRRWGAHAEPWSRAAGTEDARADYLASLGYIALSDGDLPEARAKLEEVLEIRERDEPVDQAEVLRALNNLGVVVGYLGDLETARKYHERALALRTDLFGPAHPAVASSHQNLGMVAKLEGNLAEARQHTLASLGIIEEALGPLHPDVASTSSNLAAIAYEEGDMAEARKQHERALAILEKLHEPDHPLIGTAHHNLSSVALQEGNTAEAREHLEKAMDIIVTSSGEDHPDLALSLNVLGKVAMAEGKLDEAREHFLRALAINEKALGEGHADVATSCNNLGGLELRQAHFEAAREYFQRGLAVNETALGPEHPYTAYSLLGLGRSLAGLRKVDQALPLVERGLKIYLGDESNARNASDIAEARLELARLLWDASPDGGRNRARARELAGLARDTYRDGGPDDAAQLAEAERWLASHPG